MPHAGICRPRRLPVLWIFRASWVRPFGRFEKLSRFSCLFFFFFSSLDCARTRCVPSTLSYVCITTISRSSRNFWKYIRKYIERDYRHKETICISRRKFNGGKWNRLHWERDGFSRAESTYCATLTHPTIPRSVSSTRGKFIANCFNRLCGTTWRTKYTPEYRLEETAYSRAGDFAKEASCLLFLPGRVRMVKYAKGWAREKKRTTRILRYFIMRFMSEIFRLLSWGKYDMCPRRDILRKNSRNVISKKGKTSNGTVSIWYVRY